MVNVGKKIWKRGDLFIWLTGAGLAFSLIITVALVLGIVVNAMGTFWPGEIRILHLNDGSQVLGTQVGREVIPDFSSGAKRVDIHRIQIKKANRDIYTSDFIWVDESQIKSIETPENVVAVERREWGYFFGFIKEIVDKDKSLAQGTAEGLKTAKNI